MAQIYHMSRASWHHAPCQDKPPLSAQERTDARWGCIFNGQEWTAMPNAGDEGALLQLAATLGCSIEVRYPDEEGDVAAQLIILDDKSPRLPAEPIRHFLIVPDLD